MAKNSMCSSKWDAEKPKNSNQPPLESQKQLSSSDSKQINL